MIRDDLIGELSARLERLRLWHSITSHGRYPAPAGLGQPTVRKAAARGLTSVTQRRQVLTVTGTTGPRYLGPMRRNSGDRSSASLLHGHAARRRSICSGVSCMIAK